MDPPPSLTPLDTTTTSTTPFESTTTTLTSTPSSPSPVLPSTSSSLTPPAPTALTPDTTATTVTTDSTRNELVKLPKRKGEEIILEFLLSNGKRYKFPPSSTTSTTISASTLGTGTGEGGNGTGEGDGFEGFGLQNTAREILEVVWNKWPVEWKESNPRPDEVGCLRLLYLGKFLDDSNTLASVGLKPNSNSGNLNNTSTATIFHLLIRNLQPLQDEDVDLIKPHKTSSCCLIS